MTERWLDGWTDGKLMSLLYTLAMTGSHAASLVKFRPAVYHISSVVIILGEQALVL